MYRYLYVPYTSTWRILQYIVCLSCGCIKAGRLLLRKVVADILKIPYSEIQLSRTEKGKPYLEGGSRNLPDFSFNVSHQGSYAVLAAETGHPVGVDVMQIEPPS